MRCECKTKALKKRGGQLDLNQEQFKQLRGLQYNYPTQINKGVYLILNLKGVGYEYSFFKFILFS